MALSADGSPGGPREPTAMVAAAVRTARSSSCSGRSRSMRSRATLTAHDRPVALQPKTFELLEYLVRHPGRLLTKDELIDALWSGGEIGEGNLSQQIFLLRGTLARCAPRATYVVTEPGRGYRFVAHVATRDALAAASGAEPNRLYARGRYFLEQRTAAALERSIALFPPRARRRSALRPRARRPRERVRAVRRVSAARAGRRVPRRRRRGAPRARARRGVRGSVHRAGRRRVLLRARPRLGRPPLPPSARARAGGEQHERLSRVVSVRRGARRRGRRRCSTPRSRASRTRCCCRRRARSRRSSGASTTKRSSSCARCSRWTRSTCTRATTSPWRCTSAARTRRPRSRATARCPTATSSSCSRCAARRSRGSETADEARAALAAIRALARRGRFVSAYNLACVPLGLDEHDAAVAALERGFAARDPWLIFIPRASAVRRAARRPRAFARSPSACAAAARVETR